MSGIKLEIKIIIQREKKRRLTMALISDHCSRPLNRWEKSAESKPANLQPFSGTVNRTLLETKAIRGEQCMEDTLPDQIRHRNYTKRKTTHSTGGPPKNKAITLATLEY